MRLIKFSALILVLSFLVGPFPGSGTALAAFVDIDHNWAREAISSLETQGIFEDLWVEEFSPSTSITHNEMFSLLNQVFQLKSEEEQALKAWLSELLVAHPEGVTRGEFATALANLLALGENMDLPQGFYPSFADLSSDYPGFVGVELVQRLGLLPAHMLGRFEPYRLITRSEVAFILDQAQQLTKVEGVVEEVAEGGQFSLRQDGAEEALLFRRLGETLYVAPSNLGQDSITKDQELQGGQRVMVLARKNQALLINLHQNQVSTTQALMDGLNNATKALVDLLTPAQINAIIAGDWDQLGEEVSYELYEELVDRGISPWEADALLKRDWVSVQMMLQERLTQEAAGYLGVAPEMVQAAVSQDWDKLLEYAQAELVQRLLTSDWLKEATSN